MNDPVAAVNVFGPDREETSPAIDRTALAWIKRNCCSSLAAVTISADLDAMPLTSYARQFDCFKSQVFGFLTILTAFWRVLEILVAEEGLFSGGPDELILAIDAGDQHVRKCAASV